MVDVPEPSLEVSAGSRTVFRSASQQLPPLLQADKRPLLLHLRQERIVNWSRKQNLRYWIDDGVKACPDLAHNFFRKRSVPDEPQLSESAWLDKPRVASGDPRDLRKIADDASLSFSGSPPNREGRTTK